MVLSPSLFSWEKRSIYSLSCFFSPFDHSFSCLFFSFPFPGAGAEPFFSPRDKSGDPSLPLLLYGDEDPASPSSRGSGGETLPFPG